MLLLRLHFLLLILHLFAYKSVKERKYSKIYIPRFAALFNGLCQQFSVETIYASNRNEYADSKTKSECFGHQIPAS